jgi:uncharacterized protein (DUF2252 family)
MWFLLVLGLGCAPTTPDDARSAWLVDALVRDNAVWLSRDPSLLEAKYAAMAADPYAFLRGTLGVAWADQTRPGSPRTPTSFVTTPGADLIWLVGDPHPENFSFFAAPHLPATAFNLPMCVDIEDFDGSGHGPWIWDVRRLALGLSLAAERSGLCDADCRSLLVDAVVDGYVDAVLAEAVSDVCAVRTEGTAIARWASKAEEDALAGTWAAENTERTVFDPARGFRLDQATDDAGDGLLETTPGERAQIDRLWAQLHDLPERARIVDTARRFGAGVASMPAVRYLVLWDEGDATSDADDRVVQFREVIDPPSIPGRFRPVPATFDDATDRVRAPAEALWSHPDLDPWLLGLADGTQTFKRTAWGDLPAGLEADDLAEDLIEAKFSVEDLAEAAGALARRLAGAHRAGPTLGASEASAILRAEVAGRREVLRAETQAATARELALLLDDVSRLQQALERLGPDLGAGLLDLRNPLEFE